MGRQIAGQIPDNIREGGGDLSLALSMAAWADEGRGASHPASIGPAPCNLGLDLFHFGFKPGRVLEKMRLLFLILFLFVSNQFRWFLHHHDS